MKQLRDLRKKLTTHFNLDELQTLSFDLSVDWNSLSGDTIELKSQTLISYLFRRGKLSDLVGLLREERPNVEWADTPLAEEQIEMAFKELLAQYIQLGEDLLLAIDLSERKRIWRAMSILESKLQEAESSLIRKPQTPIKDVKGGICHDYLEVLKEEYEIIYKQISYTLDDVQIVRMKRRAVSMEEEIFLIENILSG